MTANCCINLLNKEIFSATVLFTINVGVICIWVFVNQIRESIKNYVWDREGEGEEILEEMDNIEKADETDQEVTETKQKAGPAHTGLDNLSVD